MPALFNDDVKTSGLGERVGHCAIDRRLVGHIERQHSQPFSRSQPFQTFAIFSVSPLHIAHRRDYVVTSAGESLGGVMTEPGAGSRDEHALGHRLWLLRSFESNAPRRRRMTTQLSTDVHAGSRCWVTGCDLKPDRRALAASSMAVSA